MISRYCYSPKRIYNILSIISTHCLKRKYVVNSRVQPPNNLQTPASTSLIMLRNNTPRKLSKSQTILNLLPKIRLRKHSQGIPRNLLPRRTLSPLNKMRHSPELAPGNKLQSLASLKSETILWNVHLDDLTGTRANIQPRLWIRRLR